MHGLYLSMSEMKKYYSIFYYLQFPVFIILIYLCAKLFMISDQTIYCYFDFVNDLQTSNPIYMSGVQVGRVSDLDVLQDGKIKVTLSIRPNIVVRNGASAMISPDGLTSGTSITLNQGQGSVVADKTTLPTTIDSSFLSTFKNNYANVLKEGKIIIHSTDSIFSSMSYLANDGWTKSHQNDLVHVRKIISSYANTSDSIKQLSTYFISFFMKADDYVGKAKSRNMQVNEMISKTDTLAKSLSLKITKTDWKKINQSFSKFGNSIKKFEKLKLLNSSKTYSEAAQKLDTLHKDLNKMYSEKN